MTKYVIKRICVCIVLFFILTFVLFIVVSFLPTYADNDIQAYVMQFGSIDEEQKTLIYERYDLDEPVVTRYFKWIGSLFDGTWSYSHANLQTSVLSIIKLKISNSLTLMVASLFVAVLLSIPLGIFAALKPGGIADGISNFITFIGVSIPGFIVAIFLIFVFGQKLAILPSMVSATSSYPYWMQLILPVVCVSISIVGPIVKQVRGSMLDVMNSEYVKTARSKGIRDSRVVIHHMLRNAAIPVVTAIGLALPMLVGGSVVVEQIFTVNGIGNALIQAIYAPADAPLIMGIVAVQVLVVLVVNLLLDLVYTVLDPRVSY